MREAITGADVDGRGGDGGEGATPAGKGNALQRKTASTIQRAGGESGGEAPSPVEDHVSSTRGGGDRLSGGVLQKMNSAFGQDFGGVGIHTDATAADACRTMGAQAFTVGSDVYFDQGKFDPGSQGGQELIGHELTHVVQQGGGQATGVQAKLDVGSPGDAHEQQADAMGAKAAKAPEPGAGPGGPGGNAQDPNAPKKVFGKGDAGGVVVTADANQLRMTPADVGFGDRDYSIVGKVPGLVQSHIATSVPVTGDTNWKSIWSSRWIVYDASDKVVDESDNWKHPDYTLSPATVKAGVPSDGGSNAWTVRFETMKTGALFGGGDSSNFPWDQSRFHVYASPIASPAFTATEERGNDIVARDTFSPVEDGGSYQMQLSGTSSRAENGSETVTTSAKLSSESESSGSIMIDGVGGGFKDKIGFEAQRSIAKTKGLTVQQSQTIARTFQQTGLKKGKTYHFNVYPTFTVLTGSANVLNQNMGIVSGAPAATTGSIRIWTGYAFTGNE